MASLSAEDLARVRRWCGNAVGHIDDDPYSMVDLVERSARLGTPEHVALEVLSTMRADMLADPASVTLTGDYSQDASANLRHLDARIAELQRFVGDEMGGGIVRTTAMVRQGRRR